MSGPHSVRDLNSPHYLNDISINGHAYQREADFLVMPSNQPGYVKALFGTDQAIWANGGAGTAAFGNAATVKYTFADVSWGNYFGWGNERALDATQQTAAKAAMQMWSNVANVTFVQGTASDAVLAFRNYNLPSGAGVAVTSSYNDNGGGPDRIAQVEVSMDDNTTGFTAGGYGWLSYIHEVGHSIGIKHPGNYNAGGGGASGPYLTDFGLTDNRDYTVMSYNNSAKTATGNYPTTPMLYDIATAQFLYGKNMSYNATNTTYTLTATKNMFARWDAGGTDILDASGVSTASILDLREGEAYFSKVGTESYSWNAFGANIENAKGGAGADTITGNGLANVLTGGGGNDTLTGGAGNDTYVFGTADGNDTVIETDGSGTLILGGKTIAGTAVASGSNYTLSLSGTTFTFSWAGANLKVAASGMTTTVTLNGYTSGWFGFTLSGSGGGGGGGGGGSSDINGTASANTINDTSATQVINGLGGNDTITSKTGADTVNGGDGNDIIRLYAAGAIANGDAGNDSIFLYGNGERANGGVGDDKITAATTVSASTITGGLGRDTIVTYGINSSLSGDEDADSLSAKGAGSTLSGGAGNDKIMSLGANQRVDGGADIDTITVSGLGSTVVGGAGNDVISVTVVATSISGDDGNDKITLNLGGGTVNGGLGDDLIKIVKNTSIVNGGGGNDTISGGGVGTILNGDDGTDSITVSLTGGIANGGAGNDKLIITSSSSTLNGDAGNDTLLGGSGHDTLSGGADVDSLVGGSGNDKLYGGDGNDILLGGIGADFLDGGNGNDTLLGGTLNDTLTGGAGNDIFRFEKSSGTDTITDFVLGQDKLQYTAGSISEATALKTAVQLGDDVKFTLNGTILILEDHQLSDFTGQDFIL